MACYCGSCWKHDSNGETAESLSTPAFYEGVKAEEDVRATKPHSVQVTLLVDSEDTGRAVSKVLGAVAVGGVQVHRISALPYEPEEDRW